MFFPIHIYVPSWQGHIESMWSKSSNWWVIIKVQIAVSFKLFPSFYQIKCLSQQHSVFITDLFITRKSSLSYRYLESSGVGGRWGLVVLLPPFQFLAAKFGVEWNGSDVVLSFLSSKMYPFKTYLEDFWFVQF